MLEPRDRAEPYTEKKKKKTLIIFHCEGLRREHADSRGSEGQKKLFPSVLSFFAPFSLVQVGGSQDHPICLDIQAFLSQVVASEFLSS